jgi:hypothetical protein
MKVYIVLGHYEDNDNSFAMVGQYGVYSTLENAKIELENIKEETITDWKNEYDEEVEITVSQDERHLIIENDYDCVWEFEIIEREVR